MPGAFSERAPAPRPSFRIKRAVSARIFVVSSCVRLWASLMTIFAAFSRLGAVPQIKIGNDLVERLQEECNRLRIEVRLSFSICFNGNARASRLWRDLQRGNCDRGRVSLARAFYDVAFASRRMTSL